VRILFFTEFADTTSAAPGFAIRSSALARHLSQLGISVTLVSSDAISLTPASDNLHFLTLNQSRATRKRGTGVENLLSSDVQIARAVVKVLRAKKHDGVIAAAHDPLLATLVLLTARLACRVAVFDVHDSWLVLEKEHSGKWKNRLRKLLERLAMSFSTNVTAVTPTLGLMIAKSYRIRPSKISVVFSGSETTEPMPEVQKDIDLLHLGSPRPYYDTEAFVDALSIAFGRGRSFSVVFLGCDDGSYVRKIKRKVSVLRLNSHVAFIPPVPRAELPKWLARAKMGLQTLSIDPIYRCAIGVKVFEYLSHGVPILHLGPEDGETSRLIKAAGCGECASDPPGMADAMKRNLSDSAGLARMSSSALAIARQYSWDSSARVMAELLNDFEES
jgi:glycosyltransferase involved in cell wall biosynthesis